ncbi:MAG TPA: amidohydrolase family protein [Pyrinomonadaceae bacterium]|nr:amidohydrolase family protein [Pyrinomonadaceae bacterium]
MRKMLRRSILIILILGSATVSAQIPTADHHQHLFSPMMAEFQKITPITAADVIKLLDEAGIKRGVLLSTAYAYGRPGREPKNEYEKVKEENDWVAAEAAKFPKRLIAFCGFNPLKEYALEELARCANNPNKHRGIKLHFGNSDVQLEKPEHIEKLKAVFRAANENRMAIVVHMRASISLNRPYGAEQVRAFLDQLMPLTAKIVVQVAHLVGSGPGFNDSKQDAALDGFVEAIQNSKSKAPNNLWFDLTTSAHPSNTPERTTALLKRIRQIGVRRILYGTDAALGSNLKPKESWAEVTKIGLTFPELKTIANNRAPYWR